VKYSRLLSYIHYIYYLLGQFLTVIPMFWLGYAGMPRRVLDYPSSMGGWHSLISAGHLVSVGGMMAFFIMIFESLRKAKAAMRNTFGISRYNTRVNFYFFMLARLEYFRQRYSWFSRTRAFALFYKKHNFEILETTLVSISLRT
jgi:heme/copper-type cytochrome/quinol oxidase subunit 1